MVEQVIAAFAPTEHKTVYYKGFIAQRMANVAVRKEAAEARFL